MADYSDLLARLGAGLPYRAVPTTAAERQADPAVIKNVIDEDALRAELAECAAAIRALIAERDVAASAEREACATVCSLRAITVRQGAPLDVWKTAASCEAMECAAAIRGRSNG